MSVCVCIGSFLFYTTPIVFNSNFVPFDGLDDLDGFDGLDKKIDDIIDLGGLYFVHNMMTLRTFILPMIDDKLDCWFFF